MNNIQITESQLNKVIKKTINRILKEEDQNRIKEALMEDVANTIESFKNAQALAYNIGLGDQANQIMQALYDFQNAVEME